MVSPTFIYLGLFVAATFGGLVDSIAGGGGLICLPALMATGIPPSIAIATNKLQSVFGSFNASLNYCRSGKLALKPMLWVIVMVAIGALLGSFVVVHLSQQVLMHIVPVLLSIVLIYMVFGSNKTLPPQWFNHHHLKGILALIFGLLMGFYDGFFGPGTGSFWVALLMLFLGEELLQATMQAKVYNFTSNLFALGYFLFHAHIMFYYGAVMALGQIAGSQIGAKMVLKKGSKIIRPIFITAVSMMIIVLVYRLVQH